MADRIVVLHAGRVLQEGPPRNVYLAPRSPVVARQLGQPPINLFEAHCDGARWFARDGTPLCDAQGEPPGAGMVGVRPEHLSPFGGDAEGRVLVVEDTGPARILLVRWAGADVHVLAPRDLEVNLGDALAPRIDPTRAVVWRGAAAR